MRSSRSDRRRGLLEPRQTVEVAEERPPICPRCGVTMVSAELSAYPRPAGDWVCLECEETAEADDAASPAG
jgi:tRNA(Ile2) C34 agmatinyltransferase TiaS